MANSAQLIKRTVSVVAVLWVRRLKKTDKNVIYTAVGSSLWEDPLLTDVGVISSEETCFAVITRK